MKITDFKAGKKVQRFQYRSFEPSYINKQWIVDDPSIIVLLNDASNKLGELNAYSQLIPDVDNIIKMHTYKEGTESSRIEGTKTSIEEAVQKERDIALENRDDWHEVQNYVNAMAHAIDLLKQLPISNRLIKEAHKVLLQGVRGKNKHPGEFRKSQNWIGGNSLKNAFFIPPVQDSIPDLMADLEKFLNNENDNVPALIKIGIAHYQFETIHPFLDGNGRIGRLLITLFLVSNDLLSKPSLYISDFFEKNRMKYYDMLTKVRDNNALDEWLRFFLEGVLTTSKSSIQTFKDVTSLREEQNTKIAILGKKTDTARAFLKHLYGHPVVNISDVSESMSISFASASRLVKDFQRLNILIEQTGNKRNKLFSFKEYLDIFEG